MATLATRFPTRTAARRALSLTFFVAQRKAEDPVVEVEIPTGRYDHRAGGRRGSLDEVWPGAAHGGEAATSRPTWRALCGMSGWPGPACCAGLKGSPRTSSHP